MKYLIFPGEAPEPILDRSYVTNIQIQCHTMAEALMLIENYADKDWGSFSISRGGNVTEYTGYFLDTVVIDCGDTVVHFVLAKTALDTYDSDEYAEAGRILLGEAE